MEQRAFEHEVLGMCGNDYEAPHTISADLSRELQTPVTEAQVRAALVSLASAGLVQAYVFEKSSNRYVPIDASAASTNQASWFMMTPEGRRAYGQAS